MSLTTIPVGIRVQIWRLLLTRPCPVDILYENKRAAHEVVQDACHAFPDKNSDLGCGFLQCIQGNRRPENGPFQSKRWICVGPMFSLGVLLICRTIYVEAIDVLYTQNKFVLNALSIEDIPSCFDFSRIRSLHLDAQHLSKKELNLQDHKKMVQSIRLHPEVRLTITNPLTKREVSHDLPQTFRSLGPVKLCTLSVAPYSHAERLATTLMNNGKQLLPIFTQYNKLPQELRYHILSFTDLVQNYYLWHGQISFTNNCCRKCCETLFGCCCIQFRRRPAERYGQSVTIGSRFSKTCQCKYDPLELLQVSPEFQKDALRVLFTQSGFDFVGPTSKTLEFLHRIEQHLTLLRTIILNLGYEDYDDWKDGHLLWDRLIDYMEHHLSLPLLSLRINGSFTIYADDPLPPARIEAIRVYYRTFIPGLQRLIGKGLAKFSIRFQQHELRDWHVGYEQQVMGEQHVKQVISASTYS